MKKRTKFTGIFPFLVIKLETPLVLKVQTRTTLEQRMLLIKNYTILYNKKNMIKYKIFLPFLDKFGPKNQDFLLRWNLVPRLIQNFLNSNFSLLDQKYLFGKSGPNRQNCLLIWNLTLKLIQIWWLPWWYSFNLLWTWNNHFWANLVQKTNTICWRWKVGT